MAVILDFGLVAIGTSYSLGFITLAYPIVPFLVMSMMSAFVLPDYWIFRWMQTTD